MKATSPRPSSVTCLAAPTSYSWGTENLQLVRQMLQQQVQLSITLESRNKVGVSFTSANCKTLGFESPLLNLFWSYTRRSTIKGLYKCSNTKTRQEKQESSFLRRKTSKLKSDHPKVEVIGILSMLALPLSPSFALRKYSCFDQVQFRSRWESLTLEAPMYQSPSPMNLIGFTNPVK